MQTLSFENLKINKTLRQGLTSQGITEPIEIQVKALPKIRGGKDLVIVSPSGAGKTTTLVLSVLMRLNFPTEIAPRALILVENKDKIKQLAEVFESLGQATNLRITALYPGGNIESQKDTLADGTDVVITTPDRLLAIYYKSGINLNKLTMFILDDADLILKQGFKAQIIALSESMPKCQHLVFTEVLHNKLESMNQYFLNYPETIEVAPKLENKLKVIPLSYYQVPNYKTKLNLLNLLLKEDTGISKAVIFVNTAHTAENLYKSLNRRIEEEVVMLSPCPDYAKGIESLEQFQDSKEVRILILSGKSIDIKNNISLLLHFDLPLDTTIFINRVLQKEENEETGSIVFATDLELSMIKKIEQEVGQNMQLRSLPSGLIIEGDAYKEETKPSKHEVPKETKGAAFHEKKPENAKDYNYGYKDKLKMFGKKHRKDKKLP